MSENAANPPPARPEEATDMNDKIVLSEEEWKARLTPKQYRIARRKGTERAFSGEYWNHKERGTYHCVACGQELFHSDTKFKSGSGWPSFTEPSSGTNVAQEDDRTFGMVRTEVLCSRCDSHLGHVFEDGPPPAGKRYCINSASLDFRPAADK